MGDRHKLLYEDDSTISLVVKTVTSDDDGVYKVIATNAAGSSEDTVTLNIKGNIRPLFKIPKILIYSLPINPPV